MFSRLAQAVWAMKKNLLPSKLDETISLTSEYDIDSIITPLKNYFGITYFAYVKSFNDGSHIFLSNKSEWTKCFYENFYELGTFHKTVDNYSNGYILWNTTDEYETFKACKDNFNFANGITLIEKNVDTCEFFGFASTPENYEIINFYINNLDLLKKFAHYFRYKANDLIIQANSDRLILPCLSNTDKTINPIVVSSETDIQKFYNEIKLTSDLPDIFNKNTLSKQEKTCTYWLIQGKSIKEIAKLHNLSPRTVESYLNKAKYKLSARNKADLIVKGIKNGICE